MRSQPGPSTQDPCHCKKALEMPYKANKLGEMRRSIIFGALMSLLLGEAMGQESPVSSRGESELRQAWQLLNESQDLKSLEEFMKSRFLVAASESYYSKPDFSPELHIQSPQVAYLKLAYDLHSNFFKFAENLKSFLSFIKSVINHPLESFPIFSRLVELLGIAFIFSFLLIGIFYLWGWATPISKDWPRFAPSPAVFRLILLMAYVMAAFFHGWHLLAIFLAPFVLQYSRKQTIPLACGFVLAALWGLRILQPSLESAADQASAIEALSNGRTRIEYSPVSLARLNSLQSAIWSNFNGDRSASRSWIQKTDDGYAKDLFLAVATAKDSGAIRGQQEFEALIQKYGSLPKSNFNISKVYILTQNLLAADRAKEKIDAAEYAQLSEISRRTNSDFVLEIPENAFEIFWAAWKEQIQKLRYPLGAFLLLPWILLLVGMILRNRASGLCDFTGESTSRVELSESPGYQSTKTRVTKQTQPQRQEVELAMRGYQRALYRRIQHWNWLIPFFRNIVLHQDISRSFMLLLLLSLIVVFSLPSDFFSNPWISLRAMGFFVPGITVFLLLVTAHLFDSYRKAFK